MPTLNDSLAQHPFVHGFSRSAVLALLPYASLETFAPDEAIFSEGQPAHQFYLIIRGKVALEILVPPHKPIVVETIETGDALGWSWLFPPYNWHFSAHALESVEAIEFDSRRLRALCDTDHDLGYELMKRVAQIMSDRLQSTRLQMIDLYGLRH